MTNNSFPLSEIDYEILFHFSQPMTATQLSSKMNIPVDQCNYMMAKLAKHGLVRCLNPEARRSRLFWLLESGKRFQIRLRQQQKLPPVDHDFPSIDWHLYGSICFSHRSAVIKTLAHLMQPAQIKRKAFFLNPNLRMSANNVRDVIQFLRENEIVQTVKLRKKAHLHYELTEQGRHFRRLLLQAEVGE